MMTDDISVCSVWCSALRNMYIHVLNFSLQLFDPTIKKKSKKKKAFDLEAAINAAHEDGDPVHTSTTPDKENLEPSANNNEIDGRKFNSICLMLIQLVSLIL